MNTYKTLTNNIKSAQEQCSPLLSIDLSYNEEIEEIEQNYNTNFP